MQIKPLNPNNAKQVKILLLEHGDHLPYAGCFAAWNIALWLYSLVILLVGAGQGKLPIIHALEDDGRVLGVSILARDRLLRHRWQIEQLVLSPHAENTAELGMFLINYLISTYGATGGKTFLAYVNERYTDALDLLKVCGFHQAMTRESHRLPLPPSTETLSGCPFLSNGWKRLTPHYYETLSQHYNDQLPALWRSALERLPAHFQEDTQRQGLPLERWWLPTKALMAIMHDDKAPPSHNAQGCALYIEMVRPSTQGKTSLDNWQITIFPSPHMDLPLEACLQCVVDYCYHHDPNAAIELNTWSYQSTVRQAMQPFVDKALLNRTCLLIRDCKTRKPKGANTRIEKALLLMESASGGGSASPA